MRAVLFMSPLIRSGSALYVITVQLSRHSGRTTPLGRLVFLHAPAASCWSESKALRCRPTDVLHILHQLLSQLPRGIFSHSLFADCLDLLEAVCLSSVVVSVEPISAFSTCGQVECLPGGVRSFIPGPVAPETTFVEFRYSRIAIRPCIALSTEFPPGIRPLSLARRSRAPGPVLGVAPGSLSPAPRSTPAVLPALHPAITFFRGTRPPWAAPAAAISPDSSRQWSLCARVPTGAHSIGSYPYSLPASLPLHIPTRR
jgi:hypothetical protein